MHISHFLGIVSAAVIVSTSLSFGQIDDNSSPLIFHEDVGESIADISGVSPTSNTTIDPQNTVVHLRVQDPSKIPTALENGRILVSTVESYDVYNANISACSLISRNNIIQLLTAMGIALPWVAQGDAHDLIRFGRINNTLHSFTDKRLLIDAINARKDEYVETVFEVYRFVARRSYALQAHRVVVFLGEDEEWYILDTLDGKKTREPQLFTDYLSNDVDAEWLVRLPGYSMIDLISQQELQAALPYLSPELRLFFHTQYFDSAQVFVSTNNYTNTL